MCGILAIFCGQNHPENLEKAIKNKYLAGRGPDDSVIQYCDVGVLAFHRLAIHDVVSGGQPMVDGTTIMMCNGEIYNYKELIKEYNLTCKTGSDCEVILHLYKKIGFSEMLNKLRGVFAIVLVDNNNIYIGRDRIGIRPLYYGLTKEGYLAVSSIPNPLCDLCYTIEYFPPGGFGYLRYGVAGEGIIITDYKGGLITPPLNRITNGMDVLRDTLMDAVRVRVDSERPIGCLLSGGLDSSIIASILVSILGASNVRTYSTGFEGSTDLKYAKKVAEYLGTKHTEYIFTPEEGFDVIPEVIRAIGSYDITTVRASVGMYLVSKFISEHTTDKVIFTGEGSDELLQGYLYFHNAPSVEEAEADSIKLITRLHMYDVLRADRCISVHGLEPRVPFLDRNVVDVVLSLPMEDKRPKQGYEKYILRKAFEYCLPPEVAWRRKEGFSDGVSSIKKPWYSIIQERIESIIPDYMFDGKTYITKEAMYYKLIFKAGFPRYLLKMPYWMPNWSDAKDPSGRLIKQYDEKEV
jgi:asparagine synthase (glutamine-hydrolysing)